MKNLQYFTKGKNQFLYSYSTKYLDFSLSSGAMLLGHSNKIFQKTLKKNINLGSNFSFLNNYQKNYKKELLKTFLEFKNLEFSNSGSEANLRAIRIARAITKKKKIAMVNGSWHGSIDDLMYDLKLNKNKNKFKIPLSSGISHNKNNVILIPYNDIEATEKILKKQKNNICAVVIEPIQCSVPNNDSLNYLKKLSKICDKNNILLWFDEIITGLRVKNLSVFRQLKIKPNIVTFAKCFGGGMPIGITCYDKKIRDEINSLKKNIFFGGTFSGNLLSTSVGLETFNFIKKNQKKINFKILKMSNFLVNEINEHCFKHKIPFKLQHFESLVRPVFTTQSVSNKYIREEFDKNFNKSLKLKKFLEKNYIFISSNCCFFISYCHEKKDIDLLIKTLKKFLNSSFFYK